MSEVSYSSMSTPAAPLGRDIISKSFKSAYSIVADNVYVKPPPPLPPSDVDNKEITHLKKSINRMEQNIDFIQREHCLMLEGLQKQIDSLRQENQDLQFQLVMRSSRPGDGDDKVVGKNQSPVPAGSRLVQDQIAQMKSALEEEKRKNRSLLEQLELSLSRNADEFNGEHKPARSPPPTDGVLISPDIRVSLDPFSVSALHRESGLYLAKDPLTVQDCELVIRELLHKIETRTNPGPLRDRSDSLTSRASSQQQRQKLAPALKKPLLQPIRPHQAHATAAATTAAAVAAAISGARGAGGPHSGYPPHPQPQPHPHPIGLPCAKKLVPILSAENCRDMSVLAAAAAAAAAKSDQSSHGHSLSRKSADLQSKELGSLPSVFREGKTGTSLPALPKPHDYNQADRHRRVHMLQRKRLDQFNNRS